MKQLNEQRDKSTDCRHLPNTVQLLTCDWRHNAGGDEHYHIADYITAVKSSSAERKDISTMQGTPHKAGFACPGHTFSRCRGRTSDRLSGILKPSQALIGALPNPYCGLLLPHFILCVLVHHTEHNVRKSRVELLPPAVHDLLPYLLLRHSASIAAI